MSLLAGAYALHFTSFVAISDVIAFAAVVATLLLFVAGCAVAMSFSAGVVVFVLATQQVADARLDRRYEGDSMLAAVRVLDFPRRNGASISFLATPVADPRIPPRIRVSWHDAPAAPEPGELWRLELRLKRPRGASNPGTFDYETWLFRERIGATGYVVNGKRNRRLAVGESRARMRWRTRFVHRVTALIDNPAAAAVVAAVAVGARHLVAPQQWLRYSQSGTTHLMAISGLHVGLAAAAAYYLALAGLALLRRGGNLRRAALLVAMLVAAGYASISGFAVPAERATLMFALFALALCVARQPDGAVILAGVCVLVVLGDPLATLMPGFKLSFGAVALLVWLSKHRARDSGSSLIDRGVRVVGQLVAMQAFLFFGLMPLTILIFNRVSLVAPFVNLVAVPLFGAVTVPLALAGLTLDGPLAPAGDMALRIAGASIAVLERLISAALTVPHAALVTPQIAGVAWAYLVLVPAWVLLPRGWPGRHVAWLSIAAIALHRPAGPPQGCFDTTVLDVGQGLAVVVRTRHKVLLYDTGAAYPGGTSVAERVILPHLAGQGIDRIDRLVISHADSDHAGGVADVLVAADVGDMRTGEILEGFDAQPCIRDEAWNWDDVAFRFLSPPADAKLDGNDASCVLQIAAGRSRVLLTGDIETGAERALLSDPEALRANAVVIPHHGSSTSSSRAFVSAAAAEIALISAGYRNRWGLPKAEVVERWRESGADVLTTSRAGAVSLRSCARDGISKLRSDRAASHRIWKEAVPD